jgi:RNA polymerase sigma factor (sigma-70 family)
MVLGRIKMFARSTSEVELLAASVRGNAQAFEVLVGRYQSLVCAITYSATRNRDKSEELAQEVFLLAWKSLDQLQDLGKFRACLRSIARNAVQNYRRRQNRDVVERAAPLAAAAEQPSAQPGPVQITVGREEQMLVDKALEPIPDTLREPLILFYRENRSIKQVAVQLGLSGAAARQRVSRGRAMLREQVAQIVERAISDSRPGKAFTAAIAASLAGAAIRSTSATAAQSTGWFDQHLCDRRSRSRQILPERRRRRHREETAPRHRSTLREFGHRRGLHGPNGFEDGNGRRGGWAANPSSQGSSRSMDTLLQGPISRWMQ